MPIWPNPLHDPVYDDNTHVSFKSDSLRLIGKTVKVLNWDSVLMLCFFESSDGVYDSVVLSEEPLLVLDIFLTDDSRESTSWYLEFEPKE